MHDISQLNSQPHVIRNTKICHGGNNHNDKCWQETIICNLDKDDHLQGTGGKGKGIEDVWENAFIELLST